MTADIDPQQRKLQILCLHGSRQDGEVLSQRLKTLRKKLNSIADLHFVSAPYTLPLQEGQTVPMRAWWRHWNIAPAEQQQQQLPHGHNQPPPQQQQQQQLQQQQSFPHGKDRDHEVHDMMAAGWEAIVLRDWAVSLQHLCNTWQAGPPRLVHTAGSSSSSSLSSLSSSSSSTAFNNNAAAAAARSNASTSNGSTNAATAAAAAAAAAAQASDLQYDGILGFSNGAAAAFLFAAHAAAHPDQFISLRFVALAGGYVPEPLEKLIPHQLITSNNSGTTNNTISNSSSNHISNSGNSNVTSDDVISDVPPSERLSMQLPYPSLHMMGSNDPLMDVADSSQLMDCFQPHGRVQLIHDSGHAVPQQSRWMTEIIKFMANFAEIPLPVGHHRAHRAPAAAAAGRPAGVLKRAPSLKKPAAAAAAAAEVVSADIEGKLHRQGLIKEGVKKGPAHHHPLIKVDSTGQPHQHVDLLVSSHSVHHNNVAVSQHYDQQQQQHEGQRQQPSGGSSTSSASAADFGDATDMQLEEIEALQAIYGSEFHLISSSPPSFTIKLRDPSEPDDQDEDTAAAAAAAATGAGPPSRLFTLRFQLPKDYPASSTALPLTEIEGPLTKNDPARMALLQHITTAAAEQQQEMGGAGGYVWQIANAGKEWIDLHLPGNIGDRRAGADLAILDQHDQICGSSLSDQISDLRISDREDHTAAAAAGSSSVPWWEKEDIDLDLIEQATAEAAAAHWRSWAISEDHDPLGSDQDLTAAAAADSSSAAAAAAVGGFDGSRGRWDYTIGLVGKPSAGKSTFFNAVVDPVREEDAAREAAFLFTTITPNIGRGFIVLPDPAPLLGFTPDQAQPAYGYAPGFDLNRISQQRFSQFSNLGPLLQLVRDCGWQQQQQQQQGLAAAADDGSSGDGVLWRRVPVVVKDVAGLVPGAYKGRGRGNAFLNDLCDADVLVHVVDVSGSTDTEGAGAAPGEGADPVQEIRWVRRELHCWVFSNIRAKWQSVIRRPNRLPGLFTGYHASTGLVTAVLRAVGVRVEDLAAEAAAAGNGGLQGGTKETSGLSSSSSSSSLSSWSEYDLHRLVAHFLAARFPILLALNKADLPGADQHARDVLAAHPHEAAIAVSAAAERKLQPMRRAGQINYLDAAAAAASNSTSAEVENVLQGVANNVLLKYGSTGVLAALTCAVALKPPRWVFPIADRETCTALAAVTSRSTAAGSSSSSSSSGSSKSGKSSSHTAVSASSALGWGLDAKARAAQGADAGVLRDCILLKPGSRVQDVYQVLKRPPYGLVEGEFVRAECRVLQPSLGPGGSGLGHSEAVIGRVEKAQQAEGGNTNGRAHCRVVRKDELVGPSNCVLLLQTNRKVSWQGGAAGKRQH